MNACLSRGSGATEVRRDCTTSSHPTRPPKYQKKARAAQKAALSNGVLRSELKRVFGVDLTPIPGIRTEVAQMLFGEIGPDFTKFRSRSLSPPGWAYIPITISAAAKCCVPALAK